VSDVIQIERDGAVARVWLNRPDIRNAFNEDSIAALAQAFAGFAATPELRAVVLGGRGKAFCAGADRRALTAARVARGGSDTQGAAR